VALTTALRNELEAALEHPDPDLELRIEEDEAGTVDMTWWREGDELPVGQFRFQLVPDSSEVHWQILNFQEPWRDQGFYRQIIKFIPEWTRKAGRPKWRIPVILSGPFEQDALDTGFEFEQGKREMVVDVSNPATSRVDQYNEWAHGSAREPNWHAQLPDAARNRTRK
jgi:hypothetical protein